MTLDATADSHVSAGRCSSFLSNSPAYWPRLRQCRRLNLLLPFFMICTILDLNYVACVLFFIFGYLVLRFNILSCARRSVCWNGTFHHCVDLLEGKVRICIYLSEPIEFPIVNEQNEVKVTLVRYFDGLFDQVLRPSVLRVRQVRRIIVWLLWLTGAHLGHFYFNSLLI